VFKTSGTITIDTILKFHDFTNIMGKIAIVCFSLALLVNIIGNLIEKNYSGVLIGAVGVAFCFLLLCIRKKRTKKMLINRMSENGCGDIIAYTSSFEENSIFFSNDSNGKSTTYQYDAINRAFNFNNVIVLLTKGNQLIFSFKKELTGNDVDSLIKMLKGKGIRVVDKKASLPGCCE